MKAKCDCLNDPNDGEELELQMENLAMQIVESVRNASVGMCTEARDHLVGLVAAGLVYDAIVCRSPDALHNDIRLVSDNEIYSAALLQRVRAHILEFTSLERGNNASH